MPDITSLQITFQTDEGFQRRGFQLQISTIKNKCRCDSGTPKSNHNCFDNDLQDCNSCSGNFHLINEPNYLSKWYRSSNDYSSLAVKQVCKQNKCKCDNGIAVENEFCSENGLHQCQSCNLDFYFYGNEKICLECRCVD